MNDCKNVVTFYTLYNHRVLHMLKPSLVSTFYKITVIQKVIHYSNIHMIMRYLRYIFYKLLSNTSRCLYTIGTYVHKSCNTNTLGPQNSRRLLYGAPRRIGPWSVKWPRGVLCTASEVFLIFTTQLYSCLCNYNAIISIF